jgi:hypothetical protein
LLYKSNQGICIYFETNFRHCFILHKNLLSDSVPEIFKTISEKTL